MIETLLLFVVTGGVCIFLIMLLLSLGILVSENPDSED